MLIVTYPVLEKNSWINFTIVVSQPLGVRSKIQEHHANRNLNSFSVMFLFFVLSLFADDIIIVIFKSKSNIEVFILNAYLYDKNIM